MESELLKELKLIRAELKYIRKNMVDFDMILTEEEREDLKAARLALREGRTRTLDEVMRARHAT